jgi:hypothetical protein
MFSPLLLRRLLPLAALVLAATILPVALARAQTASVGVTTDKSQYQIGDSIRICYTVGGAGPVTITDILADGTNQNLFQAVDDGTGYCFNGTVTPPAGTECLRIDAISNSGSGSNQTCFQVVAGGPPPAAGTDCGQITVLNKKIVTQGSASAESCFYQAYLQCSPATLLVSINGVDAGTRHSFGLQGSSGSCTVVDSKQNFVIPRPPQPSTQVNCSGLIQTSDGGLLFQSCGGDDVAVPPGS